MGARLITYRSLRPFSSAATRAAARSVSGCFLFPKRASGEGRVAAGTAGATWAFNECLGSTFVRSCAQSHWPLIFETVCLSPSGWIATKRVAPRRAAFRTMSSKEFERCVTSANGSRISNLWTGCTVDRNGVAGGIPLPSGSTLPPDNRSKECGSSMALPGKISRQRQLRRLQGGAPVYKSQSRRDG